MLKSKLEKPVEIVAGPGETVSGARIIAFESGVRLVTGDFDSTGKHYDPLCTTFWEPHRARQIAYALLLAADAADRGKADQDEVKRREVERQKSLEDLRNHLAETLRHRRETQRASERYLHEAQMNLSDAMVTGNPDRIHIAQIAIRNAYEATSDAFAADEFDTPIPTTDGASDV